MLIKRIFCIAGLLLSLPAAAIELKPLPAIEEVFKKAQVNGTFVLYDPGTDQWVGHAEIRAVTRFIPASTFKVPNSLIGLQASSVRDVDEVFYRHDGTPQMLKAWEKDMSLRDAIHVSNVRAYQALAERIGQQAMQANLNTLDYGNAVIGPSLETFWLDGSLKISAIEQVRFLTQLSQGKLPYPVALQAQVRDIIKLETGEGWTLYGKTGWAGKVDPGIGWFVGWVEKAGRFHVFALNIDVPNDATPPSLPTALAKRIDVAKASLAAAGVDLPTTNTIQRIPVPDRDVPVLQAVVVPPGTHTYLLSGMLPEVADTNAPAGSLQAYGDTQSQTVSVLRRIEAALARQGLTMGDIIQLRVYLVGDPRNQGELDFAGFQAGYSQFFANERQPLKPVRTVVQIAGLALPGALVELEATAAKQAE